MAQMILAHDIGTTGDKATLFRDDGTLVASSFSAYPTYYPHPGWAEQEPADYWEAFCASTRTLLAASGARPSDVAVIAFSGQMMAALAIDAEGNPLRRSIIWADTRSTAEEEAIGERVSPEKVYAITGHRLSASYSATKIMWIRGHEPDVYRRAAKFIHAKDFLVLRLTGRVCSDYSDASSMNLLDITAMRWSPEILEASGITESLLPDLFESPTVVGKVTAAAAKQCGLTDGTPVVIGGGDGACATCGAGVVKEGDAYICLGTSTWLATASTRPLIDPKKRTFTFCHFYKGLYFPCGTMQAGGGSLKWLKDTLGDAESAAMKGAGDVYDLINAKAAAVPAGSEGLLFLPYLMGERSPWWNTRARASFIGLTMRHTKGHMIRAVMEGVAYNMRIIADVFTELGMKFDLFRMIGGGAKSAVWRQVFADVLEGPVARMSFLDEATSIGAAIAGGVGVGIFSGIDEAARIVRQVERTEPDPAAFPVYRRGFRAFTRGYEQLVPVFDMLSEEQKS
ncbi:MAG TPA: xylulokinase [Spirochaetia bacterium]